MILKSINIIFYFRDNLTIIIMYCIRQLDLFGKQFNPFIEDGNTKFKTVLGGLTTVVIYSVSLLYTIYVFIQWGNNQIPSISNISYNSVEYLKLQTDDNILQIQIFNKYNFPIPVFQSKKRIFQPIIIDLINNRQTQDFTIINNSILQVKNLELIYTQNLNTTKQYAVSLERCMNNLTNNSDIQCASDQEIDDFFSNYNELQLQLSMQQIDKSKNEISKVKINKSLQQILQFNQTLFNSINVKTAIARVNSGLLIKEIQNITYIYDYNVVTQNVENQFMKKYFGFQSYFTIKIGLDNIQLMDDITPPSIGSIFASIGSIISILMFSQNIIMAFNDHYMQIYLQDLIVKYFYPEFKDFQIKKNFKGQIVSIKDKEKQYQHQEINKLYQEAMLIANKKLSILNIIYEISRIQFLLQQMQPKENFIRAKKMGIKLDMIPLIRDPIKSSKQLIKLQYNNKESKQKQIGQEPDQFDLNLNQSDLLLEDQDMTLLMQSHIFQYERKIYPIPLQQQQTNLNNNNSSMIFDIN